MSNSLIEQAADINTHPDILRDLALKSIELVRVVVKNPSAPPDVLDALSGYEHDPEIQRNVTANPNTPVEVLITLGADFPSELINNPVFPLLLLENPRLFQELPFEVIESILLLDDVPLYYLVMAASRDNSKILNIIANHPLAPFHALSQIASNPTRLEEAYIAAQHVNYTSEITLGWDEEIWRLAVANNPNASAETLHKLAFHPNHDVLIAVTKHENTTVETLLTLSRKRKKGYSNIRAHAMKALIQKDLKKAGTVLAEFVSTDEPTSPRFILLLHPIAPPEFLAKHANSICWIERYAVAQNPSTPAHVLTRLTTDANRLVRAVALERLQTL
ncbi:hypothetical protein NIES4071_105950 (plasmid) [Calothrix sp. NIES-4071]|nr:hypothetical protein NIES4071_105950 [Calothrix sp. NIES-4071]BAZ65013.1 hypothetical protein NIES4105_107460 [Calothrix sp. NIES-4105]